MRHALSVDVEEFYHAESLKAYLPAERPASRVEASTRSVLDLLDAHDVKATFFILGRVAADTPDVVREIAGRGHEIGCHHFEHELLWEQSREEVGDSIHRGKELLESLSGQPVVGFRAPSFSITERTFWVLDLLLEAGYTYDSSIFPIHHDRYGVPDAETGIHVIRNDGDRTLLEFPPATVECFGTRLPLGGGGYLRQLPFSAFRFGLRRLSRAGVPAMLYVHPWEFDPGQPRMPVPWLTGLRHYRNVDRMGERLQHLLREFSFAPARDVLTDWEAQAARSV